MSSNTTPKPRSEAQREASRRNGAKSRGPKTPEGKARSARNGRRPAAPLRALGQIPFLLSTESPERFQQLLEAYFRILNPTDCMQANFVKRIARSEWLIEHYYAFRSRVIEAQIGLQLPALQETWHDPSPHFQTAMAVAAEAGRAAVPYMDRLIASERRNQRLDLQELRRLRQDLDHGRIPLSSCSWNSGHHHLTPHEDLEKNFPPTNPAQPVVPPHQPLDSGSAPPREPGANPSPTLQPSATHPLSPHTPPATIE